MSAVANEVVQEGSELDLPWHVKRAAVARRLQPLRSASSAGSSPTNSAISSGLAVTGSDGSYRFPLAPGASRELIAIHRRDHRELVSRATIETIVHPVFNARKTVIYNKHVAHFYGRNSGPHNDRVVIVLQAKVGKGWSAFRRYRTRDDGKFSATYRFRHTFVRRKYAMRAQVRQTVGYPYVQGNSRSLRLLVLPKKSK